MVKKGQKVRKTLTQPDSAAETRWHRGTEPAAATERKLGASHSPGATPPTGLSLQACTGPPCVQPRLLEAARVLLSPKGRGQISGIVGSMWANYQLIPALPCPAVSSGPEHATSIILPPRGLHGLQSTPVHMHTHAHTLRYKQTHTHRHTQMHTLAHTDTSRHTYTQTQIQAHTQMHTQHRHT